MNKIEFIKEKIPFTQVANGVLTDSRLTAKAKGLYAYLYSKPDGWDFAIDRIALEMADGRKSINAGLQELESFGFLTRKKQGDGRVIYTVHFPPLYPNAQKRLLDTEPDVQNGKVPKRQSAKTGMISNKESLVIKNTNNKEGIPDEFWKEYPLKIAKHKAADSWSKLSSEERAFAVKAIKEQVSSNHFRGHDGRDFVPHPSTWLNQKRWEDEIKQNNNKAVQF